MDVKKFFIFTIAVFFFVWSPIFSQESIKQADPEGGLLNNNQLSSFSQAVLKLDLENSLGIAVNNSFDLKVIQSKTNVHQLIIKERWRDYFPTLTLSYSQMDNVLRGEPDSRQYQMSASSNIVLYDGGQRSLAYDIAKLQQILARNDYRIALNSLMTEVHNAYFQMLQLRDSIAINEKTLEHGKMQLTFIRKELELGDATRFDVMEIETKVKEIELNLVKSKNDYSNAENKFKLLLKIDWRQNLAISGDIEKDFIITSIGDKYSADELTSLAVKNRMEVKNSDVEFVINRKKYLMSKYYYFPKISMGLNYTLSDDKSYLPREKGWGMNFQVTTALMGNSAKVSSGYKEDSNGKNRSYTSGTEVNILDNMQYKRDIYESNINMNSSKDKTRSVRQQVSLEVLSNYNTLRDSWNMIEISRKRLELYDAQLIIERLKANMGESRRYDLIKKEIERGEAAIAYLNSLITYLSTASTLEAVLGVDMGFLQLSRMNSRKKYE